MSDRFAAWEPEIDRRCAELEPLLIEMRRHLHAHPESSGEERATSEFVASQLAAAGIDAKLMRDGLGVVADLDVGRPPDDAPRIALRADLDALKIQDVKTTSYASQNPGLCHACGHDAHTTVVLGAALCLARLTPPESVPGVRLRFIFQPSEETAEGAWWMVEQGAVDDIAAILATHVDPERQLGTVGMRYGTLTANCDEVEIIVEGRGGHSARPQHTQDAIAAAAHLVTTLYHFLPRAVDSRSPSVFTIGKLAGGTLPNVIPPRVEILGTLRTLDPQTRQRLKDRIEEIVHGCKEAGGAAMHLRFLTPIEAVENDSTVAVALEVASRRVVGDAGVQPILLASMGGEDFSAYLTRVPGAMLRMGCAPPGFAAPFLHAPDFDIDERVLALGTRILLRAAVMLGTPG